MQHWTLAQGNTDVIRFTVAPTSSSRVLTLCDFTSPTAAVVEWGDGTVSPLVGSEAVSHTYGDNTSRQVAIRGALGGLWHGTGLATGQNLITSLDEIRSATLTSLNNSFRGCPSVTSLPQELFMPRIANLSHAFRECTSMTGAHPKLWELYPQVGHTNCFYRCFQSFWGKYSSSCTYRYYVSGSPSYTYYQWYGQSSCPSSTYTAAKPAVSYYGQYGTGCPNRQNIAATPNVTYFQQYGTSCSRVHYIDYCTDFVVVTCSKCAGSTGEYVQIRYEVYSYTCGARMVTGTRVKASPTSFQCERCHTAMPVTATYPVYVCGPTCFAIYSNGTPATTRCTKSGGTCQGSSCPYTYSNAVAASYSCSYYGGTCRTSSCSRYYTYGSSAYYGCNKGGTCSTSSCPHPWANAATYTLANNAGWI